MPSRQCAYLVVWNEKIETTIRSRSLAARDAVADELLIISHFIVRELRRLTEAAGSPSYSYVHSPQTQLPFVIFAVIVPIFRQVLLETFRSQPLLMIAQTYMLQVKHKPKH